MRHRLLIAARSILFGWAALYVFIRLVEGPLLYWVSPFIGPAWLPTAELGLVCVGLAATGWIIGRWNPLDAIRLSLLFGAMLALWDFGLVPAINVRWLVELTIDTFESVRYLESLITAVATHALLFGSLVAGAILSRPRPTPASIVQ